MLSSKFLIPCKDFPFRLLLSFLFFTLASTQHQRPGDEIPLTPLEIFKNRNIIRRAPRNHFHYDDANGGVKLSVSPFGVLDVGKWYLDVVGEERSCRGEGGTEELGSLLQSIPVRIHGTKISILISPMMTTPPPASAASEITICIHNSQGEEIVCSPVDLSSIQGPFEVNLGPEAGGIYLLSGGGSGLEFEVVPGEPSFPCISPPEIVGGLAKGDHPPITIPVELCSEYTLENTVPVSSWYFDDKSDKPQSYQTRTRQEIEGMMERVRKGEEYYYGPTDTWMYQALKNYKIEGKRVLIMGSNVPWYESICLVYGGICTTVEYNELSYEHPGIVTFTVDKFEEYWNRGGQKFDVVWSISSFEHDGLGRYGDPLNPNGDLQAMNKLRSYMEPTGLLMVAVPIGRDEIRWNEGRVYGRKRLPMLLENFEVQETFGFQEGDMDKRGETQTVHQPVFVVRPLS